MCSVTEILKRAVPFTIALVSGVLGFIVISQFFFDEKTAEPPLSIKKNDVAPLSLRTGTERGTGTAHSGADRGSYGSQSEPIPPVNPDALQVIRKPKALYTDAARENDVQGKVRLKITLLASGEVGSITPITTLPYGLTEQAIEAARNIKFKPKVVNGRPVSVVVTFDYSFTIY